MARPTKFILICFFIATCLANFFAVTLASTNHLNQKTPASINSGKTENSGYLQLIKSRLQHFWCPARGANAHATVTFRINKDGRIYWVELTDAAGNTDANLSAIEAVNASSPFPALSSCDFLDVAADFNSNFSPQFHYAYIKTTTSDLNNAGRLYSSAVNARKSGHLENAVHNMEQAYSLVPSNIHLRDELIDLYVSSSAFSQADKAMSLLRQALLLDPFSQNIRQKLNNLLTKTGKNPLDYDTRLTLARNYEHNFQYDDALCEYGEAWLLKKDLSLIPEINLACQRKFNYARVQKWQEALKIANNPDFHTELAQAYEDCDEPQNAIAEYKSALELSPSNRVATSALARLENAAPVTPSEPIKNDKEQLRDDFPYITLSKCTVSVAVIKNRKPSIDYLKAACGNRIMKWANNQTTFRLYVDDGRSVRGYRPEYRQLMIDAFSTWIKASENRLKYNVVSTPQEANIACYWVPRRTAEMKPNELGLTKSRYAYHKKEPNLLMPQTAQVFIVTLSPDSNESINDTAMKAICLHEIGHTLGITGHSPYNGDVMYATLSPFDIPRNLSDRDVGTIKRLYQGYSHLNK